MATTSGTRSTPWIASCGHSRRWLRGIRARMTGAPWRRPLPGGLPFHDGAPVRAVDCAASLERWSRRDPFGQLMAKFVDRYEAADDRTLVIRLPRPFSLARPAVA